MESITIQVPSLLENIRIIESFIDNAKEQYHINDDIYGNIVVAITESVNNAIRHGNKEDRTKNVELSLFLYDDAIKFIIRDEGEGFNYQNLPNPVAPENLEKIGGRGIFLMKQLSDEIHFRDEGREVELIFYVGALNG
ncbi:MAG: ATP-binding protein [Thermonemataceae bacterium]